MNVTANYEASVVQETAPLEITRNGELVRKFVRTWPASIPEIRDDDGNVATLYFQLRRELPITGGQGRILYPVCGHVAVEIEDFQCVSLAVADESGLYVPRSRSIGS